MRPFVARSLALLVALFSAFACGAARAQEGRRPVEPSRPTPELASELLRSDTLASIAWGAWRAVESCAPSLECELHEALARTLAAPDSGQKSFTLRALIDAFVQLDLHLDAAEFTALSQLSSTSAAALVVAARDPALHAPEFDRLAAQARGNELIALDNLLATGAPARALARLLPKVRIRVEVTVYDDDLHSSELGGYSGMSIACGSLTAPVGFPPSTSYSFQQVRDVHATTFADGPRPVAYRRAVHASRSFGTSRRSTKFDEHEHALELLHWIAGDGPRARDADSKLVLEHTWSDAEHFAEQVGARVRERFEQWNALLERLARVGALERAQFPAEAPIHVVVNDRREDRSVALPALP